MRQSTGWRDLGLPKAFNSPNLTICFISINIGNFKGGKEKKKRNEKLHFESIKQYLMCKKKKNLTCLFLSCFSAFSKSPNRYQSPPETLLLWQFDVSLANATLLLWPRPGTITPTTFPQSLLRGPEPKRSPGWSCLTCFCCPPAAIPFSPENPD